jgi:hypothetical protein
MTKLEVVQAYNIEDNDDSIKSRLNSLIIFATYFLSLSSDDIEIEEYDDKTNVMFPICKNSLIRIWFSLRLDKKEDYVVWFKERGIKKQNINVFDHDTIHDIIDDIKA